MGKFLDEAGLTHYTKKLKTLLADKQDKLSGSEGQVVGFDEAGDPVALETDSLAGADGKSAYQYAQDGGYTGTEAEFQALMGTGPWLPLSGGVMNGYLRMGNKSIDQISDLQFATDQAIGVFPGLTPCLYSPSNGMIRLIYGSGYDVILSGVHAPVSDNHAANKKYVDDLVGDISSILDSINGEVA